MSEATLYERLGKRPGIEKLAGQIFDNHKANPIINNRYVNSDRDEVVRLVTEMCCAGFGGPETYTGRDMLTAHTGMNISAEEFIAVCDDVMDAMETCEAGKREKDEVLCILYSLKGEIVHV